MTRTRRWPLAWWVWMGLGLLMAAIGRDVAAATAVQRLAPGSVGDFVREQVAVAVDRGPIPGAAMAVVQGGKVLLQQGFGVSDVASGRPVRPEDTVFRVASLSKLLTAVAVLQLVESDRLELHRDLNDYLQRLQIEPAFERPVTLHHLLTHTSGFDVRVLHSGTRLPEEPLGLAEYLERFQPRRVRPPGLFSSYGNYGFVLAGHLVEMTAGRSFASYARETLLEPLGMRSSTFRIGLELRSRLATGYWLDGSRLQAYPPDRVNIVPAAGLCATAQDMARFMIALLGQRPSGARSGLAPSVRRALLTPQFEVNERVPGRCYGFNQVLLSGRRVLRQTGAWPGSSSVMLLAPEQNAGLFLAYNLADRLALGHQVCRAFVERFVPPTKPSPPVSEEQSSPGARTTDLAGIYLATRYPRFGPRLGPRQEVRVEASGTNLVINGQPFRRLKGRVYGREGAVRVGATGIRSDRVTFWPGDAARPSHLLSDRASYRRAKWWETSRVRRRGLVGILVVLSAGALWWPLAGGLRCLAALGKSEGGWRAANERRGRGLDLATKGFTGLGCCFAIGYLLALAGATTGREPLAYVYGLPDRLAALLTLTPVLALFSVGVPACVALAWRYRRWHPGERLLYSLVTASLLLLCLGLQQRNLLF